ncbi:TMC domain-containing protein [Phthorimaea operculella]|nr:TMC domain-containing protein [Phthorimaea operculella]
MSGGNSKNKSRASRGAGWEEAGGEFYQELYPGQEQELFENLQQADTRRLATLLPSKQARTTTVKRARSQNERRQSTYARTTQSRDNHLSMLPDLSENLSNEERTWEEIMQIKAMPVPMAHKRDLKTQLQNATKLRLQGLEQLHWRQRKVWYRFRIRFGEIMGKLELWQSPMREIEGKFGTGVVSYFLFLKWLLFLNLIISLLVISFLILPHVLLVEEESDCDVSQNSSACCAEAYLRRNLTDSNIVRDVIQGTGVMERTILFYGVYSNQTYSYYVKALWDRPMYYNMPLAYILVAVWWAGVSLLGAARAGARGFKERLVQSEGQFYMYCNYVFGGWDFCIHNDKSAKIKHKALYNELKGCLEAERRKEEKSSRSRESQILLFLKRFLVNIVVLVILVAAGVLIYYVFKFSVDLLENQPVVHTYMYNYDMTQNFTRTKPLMTFSAESVREVRNTFLEFLPFLCIVILNVIVPEIFGYLINFESYTPNQVIIVSLLRTVLLRLSSLGVLVQQMFNHITQNGGVQCSHNRDQSVDCWETYVGQQLYKLILTDFAVQLFTTFFINLPRAFIARHTDSRCFKMIGEQDFYLPKHVLDVVYTQTIIWMGTFFCPFLPIIGTTFYFLIFYVKKFTCLVNCTPSPVVYKASKSKSAPTGAQLNYRRYRYDFKAKVVPLDRTLLLVKIHQRYRVAHVDHQVHQQEPSLNIRDPDMIPKQKLFSLMGRFCWRIDNEGAPTGAQLNNRRYRYDFKAKVVVQLEGTLQLANRHRRFVVPDVDHQVHQQEPS